MSDRYAPDWQPASDYPVEEPPDTDRPVPADPTSPLTCPVCGTPVRVAGERDHEDAGARP